MLCRWLPCVVLLVCRISELLIDFVDDVHYEDDLHSYIDSYLDSRYYYYYYCVIKLNLSIIITIIRIPLSKVEEEEELISVHVISNTSNFNL